MLNWKDKEETRVWDREGFVADALGPGLGDTRELFDQTRQHRLEYRIWKEAIELFHFR